MTKFTARTLTSCVPICRNELFQDVTVTSSGKQVHGMWIVPGHVFISLDKGRKLVTFDCKPVAHHHNLGTRTLDFPSLTSAVLEVLLSKSSKIVYIVQEDGHTHSWHFTAAFQWAPLAEFELCARPALGVVSVCLHQQHNTLYWCQGQGSNYTVCSTALWDSASEVPTKPRPASSQLLTDCPPSQVLALDTGVLIVPRCPTDQTRVCLFLRPSVLELVSVVTIIGSKVRDHHDVRSPVLFPHVLLTCVSDLSQDTNITGDLADLGAKRDMVTGNVILLRADGRVTSFRANSSDERQPVALTFTTVSLPGGLALCPPHQAWAVHKNFIAIATHRNTVRLYDLAEGHLVQELEAEGGASVLGLACVRSPTLLVAMVTSLGVTVLQGAAAVSLKARLTPDPLTPSLPSDKHFQTDALLVALLSQQREENPGEHISEQLSALHRKWEDLQSHQPRSHLSETVDAYLAEFWRLEEEASQVGRAESCPPSAAGGTQEMISETVLRCRSLAPDAAMAELLWLSHKHPASLLQELLGDLDVEKEHLTAKDQAVWQGRLGLENADGRLNLQYSSTTFELVCRLLYTLRPHALVSFVRNAQAVSEQAVGVSAFVRRKHTQQYYVRAVECLPAPDCSQHPGQAASAKARIILLGKSRIDMASIISTLGRLVMSKLDGKDEFGKFRTFFAYGSRSFSVWRAEDMQLVFDSNSELSEKVASLRPELFNNDVSGRDVTRRIAAGRDRASTDKGPEPKSVTVASMVNGDLLLFVGLENPGCLAVYSLPRGFRRLRPQFQSLYTDGIPVAPDNATWGDLYRDRRLHAVDPESIVYLGPDSGLADYPLLLVAGSGSGTVTLLKVKVSGSPSGAAASSLNGGGASLLGALAAAVFVITRLAAPTV